MDKIRKDEFNSIPSEYSKIPSEDNSHKKEFNEDYGLNRQNIEAGKKKAEENNRRSLKGRLLSYLTGAAVGVSIITAGSTEVNRNKADAVQYAFSCYHEAYAQSNNGKTVAVLTNNEKRNIVGAIWSDEPVEITDDVTVEFDFMISGDIDHTGGSDVNCDGMAVNFVRTDELFLEKEKTGGEFGYIGEFGVEVDQFCNPDGEIRNTRDCKADHIAIIDDKMNHLAFTENLILHGYNWYHMKVHYSITGDNSAEIKAYIGEKLLCEATLTGTPMYYGYIGISAANGDATGWTIISNLEINSREALIKAGNKTDMLERLKKSKLLPPKRSTGGAEAVFNNTETSDVQKVEDEKEPGQQETSVTSVSESSVSESSGSETSVSDSPIPEEDIPTEPAICPSCNGYGIICHGSVEADDPEGCGGKGVVHCKACNNTGREANGKVCNWCKGTLEHICPSFEFHIECEECNGRGYLGR